MKNRFLLPLLLLCSLHAQAQGTEALHYRLSYSGLVTGFLWKDLADMTLKLTPQQGSFRENPAARLSMEVSTAGYSIAEAIHPLRYHWESILTPDLKRTLLVRVIDEGESDSHEVYWYNWQDNTIAVFRKRKQLDHSIPLFDEEPRLEWEKDFLLPVPTFIDSQQAVAPGLSYLLLANRLPGRLKRDATDPLTMFLQLRQHDFHTQKTLPLQIIHEDELAPYQARLVATEELQHGECTAQTMKIEVRRRDHSGEKGLMTMWLSDDAQRLPLRFDVEAPLGMLHAKLQHTIPSSRNNSCAGNHPATNPLLRDDD